MQRIYNSIKSRRTVSRISSCIFFMLLSDNKGNEMTQYGKNRT